MAAPHVAGAAVLLCAANPGISMSRLRAALLFSGDEFGGFPPTTITNRRLNALKALQAAAEGDTTAPSTMSDFRSRQSSLDPLELPLEWTAPGDDGATGRAASYEIRLSDTPFTTEASFANARLMLAPTPANAGTPQFINTRLPFRHPAGFFGIRAFDNAGNASAISSIPYGVDSIRNDPYVVTTSAPERQALGSELKNNHMDEGRSSVLRKIAENAELVAIEKNKAFVLMQYFGYLRRNPNDPQDTNHSGYQFWLTKLDQFGGDFRAAQTVFAFLDSFEYRDRFGT